MDSGSKGNRQVKNTQAVLKRVASSIFASFSLFNGKRLSIKVFLEVPLVLQQQSCTSRRQKFDFLYAKFSVEFNKLNLKV